MALHTRLWVGRMRPNHSVLLYDHTMLKHTLLAGAAVATLAIPALADKPEPRRQAALERLGQRLFFDPGLS